MKLKFREQNLDVVSGEDLAAALQMQAWEYRFEVAW